MAHRKVRSGLLCLALISFLQYEARAESTEIVPEDLPSESVMPALDSPVAVKNRAMRFSSRMEAGLSQAWRLDEPFLNNSSQILQVGYGLSERRSAGVKATFYNSGLSEYSDQFKSYAGTQLDKVPQPKMGYGAYMQDRLFYGKWSFGQDTVFPVTVGVDYEFNGVSVAGKTLWGVGLGLNQTTYLTRSFGVGLGYKLLLQQWIDPNSANLQSGQNPQDSDFKEYLRLSHNLELKLVFYF